MRFAIRDDDTNYFTKPEELEHLYGRLWAHVPISLAIVPFQAASRAGGAVPAQDSTNDVIYPLGDNLELVQYLRHHLQAGHIEIMLHGYNHQKDQSGSPEFLSGSDLEKKIGEGKTYLEGLLGVAIHTFVPPWNSLSRIGFEAIVKYRLNLLGFFSLRPAQRPPEFSNLLNLLRIRLFQLKMRRQGYSEISYPYVQGFSSHKEFVCHGLVRATIRDTLVSRFDLAHRIKGDFCLATHYWELIKIPEMQQILYELVEYAEQFKDIRFSTVQGLWSA